jgi:hypothetical protein
LAGKKGGQRKIPDTKRFLGRREHMNKSFMKNKRLLGVNSDLDFLLNIENEILIECPECQFDKATAFEEALQLMLMLTYDLIITDPWTAPGSGLIGLASKRKFPLLALSENGKIPGTLQQLYKDGNCRVFHKNSVDRIVPAIEVVLKLESRTMWKSTLKKIAKFPGSGLLKLVPRNLDENLADTEVLY